MVHRMRTVSQRGSSFTRSGASSLLIGKGSLLALDSVARAAAAIMSWGMVMLWDKMWLEA